MKIAVFGASGAIGRHFTELALNEGHQLNLYSRKTNGLSLSANVRVYKGELSNYNEIASAISGVDAVVSFLGPALKRSYPGMPIATGHENIIRAMGDLNVKRFITIATPAVKFERDKTSIATILPKIMAKLFLPKPYKEIVAVGELTKNSGLDWTVVRFIAPTDGDPTGKIKVTFGEVGIGLKITRKDIANFVLNEITERRYVHSMPIIGS